MDSYYIWIIAGSALLLFLLVIWVICKKKNKAVSLDEMEGIEFENYCAGLLENSGFKDVTVTKGSGDFGVDIIAYKDGISYGIQCKVYSEPVGVKAVQEVYAGKDYYELMVGAVLTNQYFTKPAAMLADKLRIMLWDGDYLERLENEFR